MSSDEKTLLEMTSDEIEEDLKRNKQTISKEDLDYFIKGGDRHDKA